MLTLPKKFFFALEAVLYIAVHGGARPVSSKEICEKHGLTSRYLESIMQHLVHAKILRGVRGPKGGYFLAREKRKLMAGEIFTLVKALEKDGDKSKEFFDVLVDSSAIKPLWESVEKDIEEKLGQLTIEDLCKQTDDRTKMGGIKKTSDFVI